MLKTMLILLLLVLLVHASPAAAPRLVVVISLDQFRYEYLERFGEHFEQGGFRYLLTGGANFVNATFKHAMNTTGPGHAVILSGSYGNQNGIIANSWYNSGRREDVYCVSDRTVRPVGAARDAASPANFIGSTFGDELRIATGFRAKVISLSNKDRAAVLMGGKLSSGTYWMVDSVFATSTYYMSELPPWVAEFNRSGMINGYFGKRWERLLKPEAYATMDRDDAPYEGSGSGLGRAFPHPIVGNDAAAITPSYYTALLTSPFGSEILAAFARAAIKGEKLGTRGVTDLLCIGFSSNDLVGHTFGPHSHEVLDMSIRTDRILADLFRFIDREVGLRNTIIVLTSDHGVAPIPEYLLTRHGNAEAGRIRDPQLEERCAGALTSVYGAPKKGLQWFDRILSRNLYLNRENLREKKLAPEVVSRTLADSLMTMHGVARAFTRQEMPALVPASAVEAGMKKSFRPDRSGDVFYALKPYFIEGYSETGTTHGEPYDYDAHVPVLLAGVGIRAGRFFSEASPADIGPTLSALIGIPFPAGREGRVLVEALK